MADTFNPDETFLWSAVHPSWMSLDPASTRTDSPELAQVEGPWQISSETAQTGSAPLTSPPTQTISPGAQERFDTSEQIAPDARNGKDPNRPSHIRGTNSEDDLQGGPDDDFIWGRRANDTIGGNDGDDRIWGGQGNDVINGGSGDDVITGMRGYDTIDGGEGYDRVFGMQGHDLIVNAEWAMGGGGNDTIIGAQRAHGHQGYDDITGTDGRDLIWGDNGYDTLRGGDGDDALSGGNGHDVIFGGSGDDRIYGDAHDDTMTGGDGSDIFIISDDDGHDVITDFDLAEDFIFIRESTTAEATPETLVAEHLVDDDGAAVLDFEGQSIRLEGITFGEAASELADRLSIIDDAEDDAPTVDTRVDVASGADHIMKTSAEIGDLHFGSRYNGFFRFEDYADASEYMGARTIVWPGGHLAETREDRYGPEFDDFFDPDTALGKPGLTEMLAYANAQDANFAMIFPTVRYTGRVDELREDISTFLDNLANEAFGEFTKNMILEAGNEYYAYYEGDAGAAEYGERANIIAEEMAQARERHAGNTELAKLKLSVQMGKANQNDDDAIIRDAFSQDGLSAIDMLTAHRFTPNAAQNDGHLDHISEAEQAWSDAITDAGGTVPDLFFSAWNAITETRQDARDSYVSEYREQFGAEIMKTDIDLDARTHDGFEHYWQTSELVGPGGTVIETGNAAAKATGQWQATHMLDLFSKYAGAGFDGAAAHGANVKHPTGHSYPGADGQTYMFTGSGVLKLMYESLEGTRVLDLGSAPIEHKATGQDVNLYGFENADKLVLFVGAEDFEGDTLEVALNFKDLGISSTKGIWQTNLESEVPDNWMELFGVPDNPNVDESPEAASYAVARISDHEPVVTTDEIRLAFDQDFELARLVIAKTDAGAEEIGSWANGERWLPDASHVEETETVSVDSADSSPYGPPSGAGAVPGEIWEEPSGTNGIGVPIDEFVF